MIRAAIVGIGWWGRTLVEAVQDADEHITFVAGASGHRSPEVQEFCARQNLRVHESFDEVLEDPDVDAVVLATPHSQHVRQCLSAAGAGKHVYCEKPLAFTLAEAEEVADAVERAGVTFMVGYNRRFHPEMARLRSQISQGDLGTLLHVESTMTFANALLLRPEQWRAHADEVPCGGLAPMGVHAIDAMIDLFGDIDSVYCRSVKRAVAIDSDDTTSILLSMRSGMTGYLGLITATAPSFSFQVYGSEKSIRLEGMTHTSVATSEERRSRLFGRCIARSAKGEERIWDAEAYDIARAALDAFGNAAAGTADSPIPLDQILHTVAVTEAIITSAGSQLPERVRHSTGQG